MRMGGARIVQRAVVIFFAAVLAACFDRTSAPSAPKLERAFVTGAAADALQGDGRFTLPDAVINPVGMIGEQQARRIALDYSRAVAPYFSARWSREHGAEVNVVQLKACDRAIYAASAYVSIAGNTSEITQRTFGPHWIVPMCSGGQTQIVVSFSAQSIELLEPPGVGKPIPYHRTDFLSFGVPTQAASSLYSPEAVAAEAFRGTGKRVATVPVLVMSPHPAPPVLVRWRIDLESAVRVRGKDSGVPRERSSLFVGFGNGFGSSGLLDHNPQSDNAVLSWTDPITKALIRAVLLSTAPANIEVVTQEAK